MCTSVPALLFQQKSTKNCCDKKTFHEDALFYAHTQKWQLPVFYWGLLALHHFRY